MYTKEICELGCPNENWTFTSSSSSFTHSFAAEWRLVCDREIYANVVEMLFFLGGLFAAFFSGYLTDKFGRRKPSIIAVSLAVITGINVLWVPNLVAYGALRFILGLCFVTILSVITLKMEMFSAKHRFVAESCDFGWALGSLLLPGIVILLPHWR